MESCESNPSSPEEVRDLANGHGVLKARSPPTLLHNVIQGMTTQQKNAVTKMGFKNILDLKIREIPTNLAYYVVSQLNTEEMVIRTPHGDIPVNREAVHEVYGFPMGTTILKRTRIANSNNETMIKAWREHIGFNSEVHPQRLVEKMMPRQAVDFMFKLDFLVLMVSTLVQTMANGRVYLRYFRSITENCDFKEFDWCKFVVDAAKECRDGWKPHSNFVGPLAFLVLLYCDRVRIAPAIERVRPVITKWESQDLKNREENEKACGFGSRELLPAWRDTALGKEYLERISALCLEKDVHFSGCGCTKAEEDDVYEGASELMEEGVVEEITRLLEKYTKAEKTKLDEAVSHFGATEKLQSIKDKWNLNAPNFLSRSASLQNSGEETQPLVDPLCQASTKNIGLGTMEQPIEVHSTIRRVRVDREVEETQPLVDPLCQASTENIGLGTMEQPIEVHSTIRRVRVDREEEKRTNVIFLLSDDEESQEAGNFQEEEELRRVQGLEAEHIELRKQHQYDKDTIKMLQEENEDLKNSVKKLGTENRRLRAVILNLNKGLSNVCRKLINGLTR